MLSKSLILGLGLLAASAAAQPSPAQPAQMQHGSMQHGHAHAPEPPRAALPVQPGQGAFAAIQEIVALLEADPATDWAKVDLAALRQHLVDMDDVTLRAVAVQRPVEGGIEVAVTGSGRTLEAIRRMVAAHARELDGMSGWRARTGPLPEGLLLTVTATDSREVAHLRGLGFFGLMASGGHHQAHHLAMAKGLHQH
jgi:hypothetical protein